MTQNLNSAYRVKAFFDKAKQRHVGKNSLEIWAKLFNIEQTDQIKRQFAILEHQKFLHEEIEMVRIQMQATDYTSTLYDSHLDQFNHFASTFPNNPWHSKQITPVMMLCIAFCCEILPPDESEIPEKELEAFKQTLTDLEKLLETSTLPAHLQRLIRKNISQIKKALNLYAIKGATAFRDAAVSLSGEVSANLETIHEMKDNPEIKVFARIWGGLQRFSKAVVMTEKNISAAVKLSGYSNKAIEWFQDLSG